MTNQDNHWRWATPEGVTGVDRPAAQRPARGQDGAARAAGLPRADASACGDGAGHADGAALAGSPTRAQAGPRRIDRWRDWCADRLPATLRGRWSFDRTTAIVLVVSVLLAAFVLGGWAWLRARPHELSVARARPAAQSAAGAQDGQAPSLTDQGSAGPMPELPPPRAAPPPGQVPMPEPQVDASPLAGGGPGGPGGDAASGPGVVVDVEGKVARPGVQNLPEGSRVIDALAAAGGALPGTDLTSLNQAQVLVDGQQILVGVSPAPSPPGVVPPGRSGGKGRLRGGPAAPVRLNSATVADLEQLPGIGPALAQRILDYRSAHGPFRSVEELQEVSGFGGLRFQAIEPLLTL
jgi:competence protein ComEA